jgi:long-subunit acyl-CoA synthetase (AMP-forming)
MANRLANALRENGVARGDRVAIYLHNSVEAVIGIFATLKAGGVFVVINHTTKRDKLLYILNNCRACALLVSGRKDKLLSEIASDVHSIDYAVICGMVAEVEAPPEVAKMLVAEKFEYIQARYPKARPPRQNIDLDLACLIYTSGSTGDPKGVMSAHSNVVFAASSIIQYLENIEDDIVINVLPLSFDYGLYQLLMTFKFLPCCCVLISTSMTCRIYAT